MKFKDRNIEEVRYNPNTVSYGKLIENSDLSANNESKHLFGSAAILSLMTISGYYDVDGTQDIDTVEHVRIMIENSSKKIGENIDDSTIRGRL